MYQKNSRKNKYFTEQIKLNERKYDLYMIDANITQLFFEKL